MDERYRDEFFAGFGLDFIPELVGLAEKRIPHGRFWTANAWSWLAPHPFRHVRTNLEYVPADDHIELVKRQFGWLAEDGRLILCQIPR